jgi:hypothetical protein
MPDVIFAEPNWLGLQEFWDDGKCQSQFYFCNCVVKTWPVKDGRRRIRADLCDERHWADFLPLVPVYDKDPGMLMVIWSEPA